MLIIKLIGLKEEEPENEKREIYERAARSPGRGGGGSVSRGRDAIPPTSGDNGGILDAIFINSGRFAERGAYFLDCQRPLTLTLIYIPAARERGWRRELIGAREARESREEARGGGTDGARWASYKL